MWHSRSVVDIVNISNKRLFTREILNAEIGSALKSGSATPRVAARPQLKHSVGAQHSTLSRAPTCCFLFYSKNIFYLIGLQVFCLKMELSCHAVAIYILVQRMGSLNLAKESLNPQLFCCSTLVFLWGGRSSSSDLLVRVLRQMVCVSAVACNASSSNAITIILTIIMIRIIWSFGASNTGSIASDGLFACNHQDYQ